MTDAEKLILARECAAAICDEDKCSPLVVAGFADSQFDDHPAVRCALLAIDRMEERVRAETAFQDRVKPWLLKCFGPVIAADKLERCDRFIEEALELVQACDYDQARAHDLVDYVFGRPIGEPSQEVGGVMVTLAALCLAHHLDMQGAGETELARILRPEIVAKIRAKQAAKPTGSALPIAIRETPHAEG